MSESQAYNLRTAPASSAASSGETGAGEGALRSQTMTATADQTRFPIGWTPRSAAEVLPFFNGTAVTKSYTWTIDGPCVVFTPGVATGTEVTIVGGEGLNPSDVPAAAMRHWTLLGTGDGVETDFPFDVATGEEWVLLRLEDGTQAYAFRDEDYTPEIVNDVTVARFLPDHVPALNTKVYGSAPAALVGPGEATAQTVLAALTPWLLAGLIGKTVDYLNASNQTATGTILDVQLGAIPRLVLNPAATIDAAAVTAVRA